MPTCSSCEQKLIKSSFAREELRRGPERRCKACVEATNSLLSTALSTRRFDEVSTDAQVERLRSRDPNTQMDAANKLWTLTRRGSEVVDRDIAAAGAIKPLVEMLRVRGDDRAWTAAMTLQALSCRSDARKIAIADAGAIPLLITLLSGDSEDDKEVAAMVLHNLAFVQPHALSGGGGNVADEKDSAEAKRYAGVVERQRQIVAAGATAPLVSLLTAPEDGAREAAAATLACLVSDSEEFTRTALVATCSAAGAIPPLAAMCTQHPYPEGRMDASRVLLALAEHSKYDASRIGQALRELEEPGASGASGSDESLSQLLERLALGHSTAASTRPEEYCSEAEQSDTIYSEGEMRHHHGARMVAVTAAANAAALDVS